MRSAIAPGETVATFVRLGSELAGTLTGAASTLAGNAAQAAISTAAFPASRTGHRVIYPRVEQEFNSRSGYNIQQKSFSADARVSGNYGFGGFGVARASMGREVFLSAGVALRSADGRQPDGENLQPTRRNGSQCWPDGMYVC